MWQPHLVGTFSFCSHKLQVSTDGRKKQLTIYACYDIYSLYWLHGTFRGEYMILSLVSVIGTNILNPS